MTTDSAGDRMVLPAHTDPIRVVPLHLPEDMLQITGGAPPAVPPKLTYRGGPLLNAVKVFTLFWGSYWQQSAGKTLAGQINTFFDDVLVSPLMDQLTEYNVSGQTIGHGQRVGTLTVTSPAPARTVSDNAIRHLLQQEIATSSAVPKPTPATLYFVYLPLGVSVSQGGGKSCTTFCGYHDNINGQIFYAAMPYPGCGGCTGGLAALDALTSTSSHELVEAITDAIPGQGWYDDNNGEIGDICAWQTKKVGAHTVQLEWSNAANACK